MKYVKRREARSAVQPSMQYCCYTDTSAWLLADYNVCRHFMMSGSVLHTVDGNRSRIAGVRGHGCLTHLLVLRPASFPAFLYCLCLLMSAVSQLQMSSLKDDGPKIFGVQGWRMRREGIALLALGPSNKFTLANVAAVSLGRANIDIDVAALEAMPIPKVGRILQSVS